MYVHTAGAGSKGQRSHSFTQGSRNYEYFLQRITKKTEKGHVARKLKLWILTTVTKVTKVTFDLCKFCGTAPLMKTIIKMKIHTFQYMFKWKQKVLMCLKFR